MLDYQTQYGLGITLFTKNDKFIGVFDMDTNILKLKTGPCETRYIQFDKGSEGMNHCFEFLSENQYDLANAHLVEKDVCYPNNADEKTNTRLEESFGC